MEREQKKVHGAKTCLHLTEGFSFFLVFSIPFGASFAIWVIMLTAGGWRKRKSSRQPKSTPLKVLKIRYDLARYYLWNSNLELRRSGVGYQLPSASSKQNKDLTINS